MERPGNPERADNPEQAGNPEEAVAAHWRGRMPEFDRVLQRLAEEGVADPHPTVEQVNRIDLMHIGGAESTDTLAKMAGIRDGMQVLDAGCGIGGTSRRIAGALGARMTGLDLAPGAVETGNALNEFLGMAGSVRAVQGSVTDMPFDGGSFDVVLLQHCAMQVADKDRLFAECARVLRPRGSLAMHEWFEGDFAPVLFPLPWATGPETSFLRPLEVTLRILADHGFASGPFVEQTSRAAEIMREVREKADEALGDGRELTETQRRNLAVSESMIPNLTEGRLRVGFIVARLE